MKPLLRTASLALLLVAPIAASACSSDDDAAPTTEVVVSGAPLMITNPVLTTDDGVDVVVGTIENVTERTIEISSVSSSTGDIDFRSADGSLIASLTIDPESDFTLDAEGVHLELVEAAPGDTVDVVLSLDIQDDFEFTAERGGE